MLSNLDSRIIEEIESANSQSLQIPQNISSEWLSSKIYTLAYSNTLWTSITKRCGNKLWIFDALTIFLESDIEEYHRCEFLNNLKSSAPTCHKAVLMGFQIDDIKSYVNLKAKTVRSTKCLSGLNLEDNDKGKIYTDISIKCDIHDLMKNDDIRRNINKQVLHNEIMSTIIEYYHGLQACRPHESDEKCKYILNDKGIGPRFNQNSLCNPDSLLSNGKKSKFKESVKSCESRFREILKFPEGNISELTDKVKESLLSKTDFTKMELSVKRVKESKKAEYGGVAVMNKMVCDFELDPWQKKFIDESGKGNNVLLQGPTSGGKTYASMGVIDGLINKMRNGDPEDLKGHICFMAPNFYLSVQTFSTIINTFSNVEVSIITKGIQDIGGIYKDGIKIVVGTPKDMWTLYKSDDRIFPNTLIIDEIHMIGSDSCDDIDKESMANMIKKTRNQVIGLSATIHDEDIEILKKYITDNTCGRDTTCVSYKDRPVPLYSYKFDGDNISDLDGSIRELEITPESTIKLMVDLTSKEWNPLLIFDEDDKSCFNHYKELVNHLIIQEQKLFPGWLEIMDFAHIIDDYNYESLEFYTSYSQAFHSNCVPKLKVMSNDFGKFSTLRINTLKSVVSKFKEVIIRERDRKDAILRVATCNYKDLGIKKEQEVNLDSLQLIPLYLEYKSQLTKGCNGADAVSPLSSIQVEVAPHLRLGKSSGSQEITNIIYSRDGKKSDRKKRQYLLRMCKAERCKESDVMPLFELLAKGLRFGIGILVENVPHIIQLKVMSLLKSKDIDAVFASQSMRMGIDYPIRTCVIRANSFKDLDVASMVQMAGRAGRRRKDTEGHAIYINISNASSDMQSMLARLKLPEANSNKGYYIKDEDTIVKLVTHIKGLQTVNGMNDTISNILAKDYVDKSDLDNIYNADDDVDDDDDKIINKEFETFVDDKQKPELARSKTRFQQKQEIAKFKKVELYDQNLGNIELFITIFNDSVKVLTENFISDRTNRVEKIKEVAKYKDMKLTFALTINNKIANVKDVHESRKELNHWARIFQEIYLMNRNMKDKDFLKVVENIFECLHQSSYRIAC